MLEQVGALESVLKGEGENDLRARAARLRSRARAGEPSDDLLVETLALVRETSVRTLGLRPYDEQIAGGIALAGGSVVEMQTGEGKTLAAVAPVALHAFAGRGAHVLTVNDYLARRDAEWMGPIYRLLGLEVGVVQDGQAKADRRSAYRCDVTYLTAREVGFDLLRDGLCLEPCDQVQRAFHLALVDEADSILVDEARIPLVIAGSLAADALDLARFAGLARELTPGVDFDTDDYGHTIALTEAGAERVERALGTGNLYSSERGELLAAVRNALHAEVLLRRDVDYIVRRGRVELVDELTGRVAERRQWPDGIQAAVEAKEGVRAGDDGQILGSITLHHLVGLYPHLAGMTATATSARVELEELYGLGVVVVPPHRPSIRVDEPDRIYATAAARDRAVIDEIVRVHATGRPILVGTVSVAASDALAAELDAGGVDCRVLNARRDEEEAAIVAEAGAVGAVTISTNMAGRGTDIRLGGGDERERERVVAAGGLSVIGTNRHESLRIDRQLRGRAGRQGDPGSSRFFVSLEDDLLRRYGIESLLPAAFFRLDSPAPIDSHLVRREVDRAQRIVEGEGFDLRRRLWSTATVLERQRAAIQSWRQRVLEGADELGLLPERAAARWNALLERVTEAELQELERRLTLVAVDRCWGEYLHEMQQIRDEVPLLAMDGRFPVAEFHRIAIAAFDRLLERIDDTVVDLFSRHEPGAADLPTGPSSTWTYLVHDDVFASNVMHTLSSRASFGLWGTLLLWPVLLAWGLWQHWRRRHPDRRQ